MHTSGIFPFSSSFPPKCSSRWCSEPATFSTILIPSLSKAASAFRRGNISRFYAAAPVTAEPGHSLLSASPSSCRRLFLASFFLILSETQGLNFLGPLPIFYNFCSPSLESAPQLSPHPLHASEEDLRACRRLWPPTCACPSQHFAIEVYLLRWRQ